MNQELVKLYMKTSGFVVSVVATHSALVVFLDVNGQDSYVKSASSELISALLIAQQLAFIAGTLLTACLTKRLLDLRQLEIVSLFIYSAVAASYTLLDAADLNFGSQLIMLQVGQGLCTAVAYQSLVQMAFEDKEVVDNLFGYLQAIWGISTVIAPALVYSTC